MTNNKKQNNWIKAIGGIAAALVLLVGVVAGFGAYQQRHAVVSTVSLDVNPSLKIEANRDEQVMQVVPLNEDARKIVGDMDFQNSDLEVTLNALIGSMLQEGYLSDMANSILISVDSEDEATEDALQKKVTAIVEKAMAEANDFSGAVLSQKVTHEEETDKLAAQYDITPGKAQLVQQIVSRDPTHTFEELATLSINELNLIGNKDQAPLENVTSSGTASQKKYIGRDKAQEIALNHAGLAESEVTRLEAELDSENGVMVYEVEFKAGGLEYDYDIHATDGTVISSHKEADDDEPQEDDQEPWDNCIGYEESLTAAHTTATKAATAIGAEQAKSIALTHAGVAAADAYALECEADTEDGVAVYDVEFKADGYEYTYEIDAATGAILEHEKEIDD